MVPEIVAIWQYFDKSGMINQHVERSFIHVWYSKAYFWNSANPPP